MNGIIYYSNTNQSKAVADYFAEQTGWSVYDLNQRKQAEIAAAAAFERVVLIFPVYCQNVPHAVKELLKRLNGRYLTAIATYGKMCYGRVLYDVQKSYAGGELVAAAYLPMKHSYLKEEDGCDFSRLSALVQKTLSNNPEPIAVKRSYKNPFADVGKDLRSRLLVKITFDKKRCIGCKKCQRECLFNAIKAGKFNGRCIRCLKCVTNCPSGALSFRNRLPLRIYLKKRPIDRCEIYI